MQALVFYLYGNTLLSGIAFAEELLPGTDFIPTATIAWLLENTELGSNFNRVSTSDRAPPQEPGTPPSQKPARERAGGDDVIDVDAS